MFGESDSESPRVGSPWDSLMAPPPPADKELVVKTKLGDVFPKLVPEVEYGNVEYKLRLLNPSPERFTRLVTQMKWRLLEGGGQAYYELGVADSGQLIGLSRRDLEASLETLEMMAGEIGASVIVVKEIEVPAALVGCAMNFSFGIPDRTPSSGRRSRRHRRRSHRHESTAETDLANATSTATETSATEDDDDSLDTPPSDDDGETGGLLPLLSCRQTHFSHAIEIASVYKPRPHRSKPVPTNHHHHHHQTRHGSKRALSCQQQQPKAAAAVASKPKSKSKPQPRRRQQQQQRQQQLCGGAGAGAGTDAEDILVRAEEKQAKRDSRKDSRRRALIAPSPPQHGVMKQAATDDEAVFNFDLEVEDIGQIAAAATQATLPLRTSASDGPDALFSALDALGLEEEGNNIDFVVDAADAVAATPATVTVTTIADSTVATTTLPHEPRLIVEALVVRKLALEEAFLDFGGFALEL